VVVVVSSGGGTTTVVGVVAEDGGVWECNVKTAAPKAAAITTAAIPRRMTNMRRRETSGSRVNDP
jgi:hypothetical protein